MVYGEIKTISPPELDIHYTDGRLVGYEFRTHVVFKDYFDCEN